MGITLKLKGNKNVRREQVLSIMFQKRTVGACGPLRKETPGIIETDELPFARPESYSSRLSLFIDIKR